MTGDTWGKVEKLNDNINTKYWESHATMTRDGRQALFHQQQAREHWRS
ncbi:MAG: hypothetical protein MZV63_35220 [Marinilabiliales bacterium]|nr:hypothetical protein [Marinilabiliales bacterium]